MHGCMYNQAMGLRRILQPGAIIVRVDPRYFRPAEVETLLGDPTKAKERLGSVPEISVRELCAEMVAEDLKVAKRHAFLNPPSFRPGQPIPPTQTRITPTRTWHRPGFLRFGPR